MQIVALVAAPGLLAIAVFQGALAAGAPLGRAAWGGSHVRLPPRLRIASAVAVVVWVIAALVVLGRAGFDVSPIGGAAAEWGTWILAGVLAIGAVTNFASSSRWERFGWGPFALILAVLCLWLALQ